MQQFSSGCCDDQNVWVVARNKKEAIEKVKREYHSIIDITFRYSEPYKGYDY